MKNTQTTKGGKKIGLKGEPTKDVLISLRVTPEMDRMIDQIAVADRRGKSEVIRLMVEDAVNAKHTNDGECCSCKYFEPYPTKSPVEGGECRRHPPVVGTSGTSDFPTTFYGDWCGDWRRYSR
jgi:hypothetical protein